MSAENSPIFSEKTKTRFYWGAGVLAAIFVMYWWPHKLSWEGDGEIDAFPEADTAKNYRLEASMEVTREWNGWFKSDGTYTYRHIYAVWPNGGTLELYDCIVTDRDRSKCVDQNGEDYFIEVVSAPDEPEADYSSDY